MSYFADQLEKHLGFAVSVSFLQIVNCAQDIDFCRNFAFLNCWLPFHMMRLAIQA